MTQLHDYQKLKVLPAAYQARLWATQTNYRAMSLVNGGREVEDDLCKMVSILASAERL